jgi:FMN-dependent NADH-azoreductase
MSKLLVITAHPGARDYSKSQQIAEAFLNSYQSANPSAQITHLDLFNLDAPDIDATVYSAFGHLMGGGAFSELSAEQQLALSKRQVIIDQFIAHDKYVFVAPMWEFSFPAVLKKYLDIICAARQTFQYNEFGLPMGLLKNKKAVFIQASGGNHTPEGRAKFRPILAATPQADTTLPVFDVLGNYGDPIVRATLAIMGVLDYQHIMIHSQAMPDYAAPVLASALTQAQQIATTW